MYMSVVGHDAYGRPLYAPVSGDVMGDVMGVGAHHRHAIVPHHGGHPAPHHAPAHHGGRHHPIPDRPEWRAQMAPGVIMPDEGMVPLPMAPQANNGFFSATFPQITFQGQLQKPFRAERLLVSTVRTGPSAVGRLLAQLFVGTDLQGGDITQWDAELIGQADAFGTRLTTKAAEPGVLIRMIVALSNSLTGTDTIFATMNWLGRIVH
jgi:hypothetical protein